MRKLVAILCLFDNLSSVAVLEMDEPSKDCQAPLCIDQLRISLPQSRIAKL